VTSMKYRYKVQGNVFALVQIFIAIPSPPWRGITGQQSLLSRSLRSLPPFLGLRPATERAYPLEPPTAFLQTLLSFSTPAEPRMLNPFTGPLPLLIQIPYLFSVRAQYILADNMETSHLGTPYTSEFVS
jgi:hypothetical protein